MFNFFVALVIVATLPYLILLGYIIITLLRQPSSIKKDSPKDVFVPPVSIVLACYNEETHIHSKITSLLSEENWISGSEIIVVSGGSTDSTNRELLKFNSHPWIRIFILEERWTKIQGVNFAVSKAQHDFLIFSDFRQAMAPGSIAHLLKHFHRSEIGVVTATLVDTQSSGPKHFMRPLLNALAIRESHCCSSLNIFGALYAQRKECFVKIPENILFDDLFVTISTFVQNKKIIQDEHAIIYDVPFANYYGPERICRLARGLLLFLYHHFDLIQQVSFNIRVRFLIYKYLKLTMPIATLLLLAALAGLIVIESYTLPILAVIPLLALLSISKTRKQVVLAFRFQYFFAKATFEFLTGRSRSIHWQKLKIRS